MDFRLTEEQELLLESVDQFIEQCKAEGLDEEYLRKCDNEGIYPEAFLKKLLESGLGTLGVPEEYGGGGVDNLTLCLVTERFARHGYSSNVGSALVCDDLLVFGSPDQVKLAAEQIATHDPNGGFALVITEPGAGSDNSAMSTTAVVNGDGTVTINGTKSFVTGARNAGYFMVVARDAEPISASQWASMWMVPASTPGISFSTMHKIGFKLAGEMCEVNFNNVTIPESNIIGERGKGFIQLMKNFEMARLVICAGAVGSAQHAMDLAAAYASERIAFGKPIGSFQLIQQKLVESEIAIRNMRNMVYEAAWKKDNGISIRLEASFAKYYCARSAFKVIDDCMQVMGGIGYIDDCPISREWRDARMLRMGGGTDEIMIHATGRALLKQYARK